MFKNVTLEIGLKPFKETSDEYIKSICRTVFEQWYMLLKNRESVSIMLWSADGSELLDYDGCENTEFQWCKFVGNANLPLVGDMPLETSIHQRKHLYIENPPKMTYKILKKIVSTFKSEGKKFFPNSKIRVGTTFDIGGEFAVSDFKYNRHKEVCGSGGCQGVSFVDVTNTLCGDNRRYAAYPDGIDDNTPMGTFMGMQANAFMTDMGFDYIWLSNGVGFSSEPWRREGKVFDGEEFHIENLDDTKEKVMKFWKLFRQACPKFPVETRGTNYSAGVDYACDGVALYDIYTSDLNITPPPNSPWAAINDDIGIEVIGQLTRNCILPKNDYMFRFYLHDIWWMNSPWYDRYESSPYDIYIPMALSRIDENGKTQSPSLLNLLSIDNSRGEMPDICACEATAHLLRAERDVPDEAAPIVLVYPLREYTTSHSEKTLREMYFGDLFLRDAVNEGFPIASVVSTDNFANHSFDTYSKSTLLVPAEIYNEAAEKHLKEFAELGGKIITYGSSEALNTLEYQSEKADICDTNTLFNAWKKFGYFAEFSKDGQSRPAMTIHRSNNAMIFSVYNRDTTVETKLKFPLGAPVLNGFSTNIEDGFATYRFDKCAHSECRVFVEQSSGTIRAKEETPENMKYRRRIQISGLENANVALFGEAYCSGDCIVSTAPHPGSAPKADDGWEVVTDSENGTYLFGKGISGTVSICMPR